MLRFVVSAAALYAAVGSVAWFLIRFLPTPSSPAEAIFPPAFWLSTGLLIAASVMMQRAVYFVRLERQPRFRKSLLVALGLGSSFVAIQSYGLTCMIRHQSPDDVGTGANAFLTVLAALHALHVTLALMLLIWVCLSAIADRYDHEYYLGPLFCAWFWHGLGIVWMLIMIIFLIATNYVSTKDGIEAAGGARVEGGPPACAVPGGLRQQQESTPFGTERNIPHGYDDGPFVASNDFQTSGANGLGSCGLRPSTPVGVDHPTGTLPLHALAGPDPLTLSGPATTIHTDFPRSMS